MEQEYSRDLKKIFNFLAQVEKLKSTLRYNATTSGRKESVAEHSWRLALIVFIIAENLSLDIDVNHALKIALVHDIAESVTGDIDAIRVVEGRFLKSEKQELELRAINRIRDMLPRKIGREMSSLWYEYEKCLTSEAKFVKALDKMETLIQLTESGHKTYDRPEFIPNYADKEVDNFPQLKDMLRIIKQKLKLEFEKGGIVWKKKYGFLD